MLLYTDAEATDIAMAKDIGDALEKAYAGWLWAVEVKSGVVNIRALKLSSTYGFVLHYNQLDDAGVRKKKAIMAGGELLERAHFKRGPYTGEDPMWMEGAKKPDRMWIPTIEQQGDPIG